MDGTWCHKAFSEARNVKITLLADFEPKGTVAIAYGVYDRREGTCQRALFVIDGHGIIRWRYVSPADVIPERTGSSKHWKSWRNRRPPPRGATGERASPYASGRPRRSCAGR